MIIIIIIVAVKTAEVRTKFWWEDLGVDVKVNFALELATKTERGSRGIV
jgi:hypothetical protein